MKKLLGVIIALLILSVPMLCQDRPTVASHSSDKFTPFVHALFGGAHLSGSGFGSSAGETAFAMALGGGLDVGVTKSVAVRIAQADYLMIRFGGTTKNDFRHSAGIVLRFGK